MGWSTDVADADAPGLFGREGRSFPAPNFRLCPNLLCVNVTEPALKRPSEKKKPISFRAWKAPWIRPKPCSVFPASPLQPSAVQGSGWNRCFEINESCFTAQIVRRPTEASKLKKKIKIAEVLEGWCTHAFSCSALKYLQIKCVLVFLWHWSEGQKSNIAMSLTFDQMLSNATYYKSVCLDSVAVLLFVSAQLLFAFMHAATALSHIDDHGADAFPHCSFITTRRMKQLERHTLTRRWRQRVRWKTRVRKGV